MTASQSAASTGPQDSSTAGAAAPPVERPPPGARAGQVVTWRAIVIAVAIMPAQAWWIVQMEVIRYNTWPTMLSLPLNTAFILLLLVALNFALRRWTPRWAFSQAELLTIYIMLAIAGVMVGYGQLQALLGWMTAPTWRATPENRWDSFFTGYLPGWLVIKDKQALRTFFDGNSNLFVDGHLRAWLVPALAWSSFVLALFVFMLSVNTLLRRRWIEEERLTFPLVQLPLAMTEAGGRLLGAPMLWVGFGLTFVVGLVNGLHVLLPAVPSLQPDIGAANQAFMNPPWSAILTNGSPFYPPYAWAIGVSVLMPLDVSFSYWFFFWFMKLEQLLTVVWGWDVTPQAPFPYQQTAGALTAIGFYSLWSARRQLTQIARRAFRPDRPRQGGSEPMGERAALIWLVLSVAFLAAFIRAAGAPL